MLLFSAARATEGKAPVAAKSLPVRVESVAQDFKITADPAGYQVQVRQPKSKQLEAFVVKTDQLDATTQASMQSWLDTGTVLPGSTVELAAAGEGQWALHEVPASVKFLQTKRQESKKWRQTFAVYQAAVDTLKRSPTKQSVEDALVVNTQIKQWLGNEAIVALATEKPAEALTEATLAHALLQQEQYALGQLVDHGQVLKSYLGKDRFGPESYRRILSNQTRAAGIFLTRTATRKFGTGLFIGPGVVLTAAHVARDLTRNVSVVRLAAEKGTPREFKVKGVLLASDFPASDEAYGDLALVGVEPLEAGVPALPSLTLAATSEGITVYEALYVAGVTESVETRPLLFDSVSVLFPEWVKKDQIGTVMLTGLGRYMQNATVETALNNLPPDSRPVARSILAAYSYPLGSPPAALKPEYTFRQKVRDYAPHFRCGFNSDTEAGDSGSAVFHKESGDLIGVFSSGTGTENPETIGNWIHHEESVGLSVLRPFLKAYLDDPAQTLGLAAKPDLDLTL